MSNGITVLVTGASGLLGTNAVLELLTHGYQVVGLVRSKSRFKGGEHKNLRLIKGDLLNEKTMERVIKGCDYVVHAASLTNPEILNYGEFQDVNIQGTKTIVQFAIIHKIKRIIYISTANVFGYGTLDDLGNELKAIKKPFSKSLYSKSKLEAQEFVLSKANDIEVVVLNPSFIIGAYDTKPTSGKLVLLGLNKRFVFHPPGGKSFICAQDVAKGIVKAITNGKNGEAYILSNENLSFKNFFKLLNEKQLTKAVLVEIPKVGLLFMGFIGDLLRRLQFKIPFSSNNMKILCASSFYSNVKAKKELGLTFSPIEKGLKEAVVWFITNENMKRKMS
ncbi:NAD-dependent epimerase/dehydratase family protein [Aestuariibaculum lutulentum]|uniref:NAD-dependent epimerase/dehydratase family protein n=1 Tax=Aestuariibaculum lutulentum TaxID=2920935 RepID=A0ABS9RKZ3_9FLAO|nr:NAD-dependent epimerase/dehydratase family protein [Aestuariibaculum lutulentum]MCH4553618.1 NAD-dependent epimerase/dehydratase family protein [Aestuariibaculum lutulentum]